MGKFKFYEVGGKVRDELLGLESKDVDYVAVPESELLSEIKCPEKMFDVLFQFLQGGGFQIFLSTPECYTIRAKFPDGHKYSGVADFVMARKEVGYKVGTRTPIIEPGTLYDDLLRRDFTVNAMAKGEDGEIIDFFDGMSHIKQRILVTPMDCKLTFDDDPLRILRAIRFSITKKFYIGAYMHSVMEKYEYEEKMGVVSIERVREELLKCFQYDTRKTLDALEEFIDLRNYIFSSGALWLKPTLETR
jgi:tRNA nucleotidyltransferase/poly(A) polymerase